MPKWFTKAFALYVSLVLCCQLVPSQALEALALEHGAHDAVLAAQAEPVEVEQADEAEKFEEGAEATTSDPSPGSDQSPGDNPDAASNLSLEPQEADAADSEQETAAPASPIRTVETELAEGTLAEDELTWVDMPKLTSSMAPDVLRAQSIDDPATQKSPSYPSGLDGNRIENIGIHWVSVDTAGAEDDDPFLLSLRPGGDTKQSMQFQVEFSLSGQYDYEPGAVELAIPAQIWHDHDGNLVGSMTLSVPEDPGVGANFAWRLVDGTYIITNTRTLSAASKAMFQFTIHDIVPHEVSGGSGDENHATFGIPTDAIQPTVTVTTHAGNTIQLTSADALTARMDTQEQISYAHKGGQFYEEAASVPATIRDRLATLVPGANPDDYVYVAWTTFANHYGNQPFTISLVDELPWDDALGAYEYHGVMLGGTGADPFLTDGPHGPNTVYSNPNVYTGYHGTVTGSDHYTVIWSAYPKHIEDPENPGQTIEQFPASNLHSTEQPVYVFHNEANWDLLSSDDHVLTERDPQAAVQYVRTVWTKPEGNFVTWKYTERKPLNDFDYGYALNRLVTDRNVEMHFVVESVGYGMPWTYDEEYARQNGLTPDEPGAYGRKPYTMVTSDDKTFFNNDLSTELTSADFKIASVRFEMPRMYDYGVGPGNRASSYVSSGALEAPSIELWIRTQDGVATAAANNKLDALDNIYTNESYVGTDPAAAAAVNAAEGYTRYATVGNWDSYGNGTVTFADGRTSRSLDVVLPDGVTDYRTVVTTKAPGILYYTYPTMVLFSNAKTKAVAQELFDQTDNPATKFRNDDHMEAYTQEGDLIYRDLDNSLATLRGATLAVSSTKSASYDHTNPQDHDVTNQVARIHYTATVTEQTNIRNRADYDLAIEENNWDETSCTWYDLLPPGIEPDISTIRLRDGDTVKSVRTVENYKNSGRILLVVEANLTPKPTLVTEGYRDHMLISFDALYPFDAMQIYGDGKVTDSEGHPIPGKEKLDNVVAFQSGNDQTLGTLRGKQGELGPSPTPEEAGNQQTLGANELSDRDKELMSDLDPSNTTARFLYAHAPVEVTVDTHAAVSLKKFVKADWQATWQDGLGEQNANADEEGTTPVYVLEGHGYSYRVVSRVMSGQSSKNIIFYDWLETYQPRESLNTLYYADTQSKRWQGTFDYVDVSALRKLGANPVVYYALRTTYGAPSMVKAIDDGFVFVDTTQVSTSGNDTYAYDVVHSGAWVMPAEAAAAGESQTYWVRADEYTGPKSNVAAIAIDCSKDMEGGDFELPVDSTAYYQVHMIAPTGAAAAEQYNADPALATNPQNNGHAFNDNYMRSTVVSSTTNSSDQGIWNHYVKVGLLPYQVEFQKVWDDGNNRDGLRPAEGIRVQLLARNADGGYRIAQRFGSTSETLEDVTPITLTGAEDWKGAFRDIPYRDTQTGEVIDYVLWELPAESDGSVAPAADADLAHMLEGYVTATVPVLTKQSSWLLVNQHKPATVHVHGTKTWDDAGDAAGKRPEAIKLTLYAHDEATQTKTAKQIKIVRPASDGSWSYDFGELYQYDKGHRITYSVEEEYVPGYVTQVSNDGVVVVPEGQDKADAVVDITNEYSPYGELVVSKSLQDATPAAAEQEFEFQLLLNMVVSDASDALETMEDGTYLGEPVGGTYEYAIFDVGEEFVPTRRTGTITTGGTLTLKGDQYAVVFRVPSETYYRWAEEEHAGFALGSASGTSGVVRASADPNTTNRLNTTERAEFVNVYEAQGSYQPRAHKILSGRALDRAQFRFELADDEAFANVIRTASNDAQGSVGFGQLRYTLDDLRDGAGEVQASKTFVYYLREVNQGKPGITYDADVVKLEVVVEDRGGTGALTVTPTYYDKDAGTDAWVARGGADAGTAAFQNTYSATGELELKAWKELVGRKLSEDEFAFTLYDVSEGRTEPVAIQEHVKNAADGSISFAPIGYTEADAGKSFLYAVVEEKGTDATVNYTTEAHYFEVHVYDNGDGTLSLSSAAVETERFATCPTCDGHGERICPSCLGAGYPTVSRLEETVSAQDYANRHIPRASYYTTGVVWEKVCRTCLARHTVTNDSGDEVTCPECNGTGYAQANALVALYPTTYSFDQGINWDHSQVVKNNPGNILLERRSNGSYKIYAINLDVASHRECPNCKGQQNVKVECADCEGSGRVLNASFAVTPAETPVFTNTLQPGTLSLEKLVTGDEGDPSQEFTFKIRLTTPEGVELPQGFGAVSHAPAAHKVLYAYVNARGELVATQSGTTYITSQNVKDGQTATAPALAPANQPPNSAYVTPDAWEWHAYEDGTVGAAYDFGTAVTGDLMLVQQVSAKPTEGGGGSTTTPVWTAPDTSTWFHATDDQLQGTAYAMLDSTTGELIFFRAPEGTFAAYGEPTAASSTTTELAGVTYTIDGVSHTGYVYTNVEGSSYTSSSKPGWASRGTAVKSARIAEGVAIRPVCTGNWFSGCTQMTSCDLLRLDTSQVTSMTRMFSWCYGLTSLEVAHFDTSNVRGMDNMFYACYGLTTLDVSHFDTSDVTNMAAMFASCSGLANLDVSHFQTSKLTNAQRMFETCQQIEELNLIGFDTTRAVTEHMFLNSTKLKHLTVGENFRFKGSTNKNPALVQPPAENDYMWAREDGEKGPYTINSSNLSDPDALYFNYDADPAGMAGTWVWHTSETTYKVSYDAAGGGGAMASSTFESGEAATLPASGFYRYGYRQTGWVDQVGNEYALNGTIPANTYSADSDIVLTAVWERTSSALDFSSGEATVTLKAGEKLTLANIPGGSTYQIWEETPSGWMLVSQTNASGVVEPASDVTASFTNTYQPARTTASIHATKSLDGKAADGFDFALYAQGVSTPIQTKRSAGGVVNFDPLTYTTDDLDGAASKTFAYTIREVAGNDSTITYDDHEENVTVTVVNNEGVLSATVAYDASGPAFQNSTKPGTLTLSKRTVVREGLTGNANQEFAFAVSFFSPGGTSLEGITTTKGSFDAATGRATVVLKDNESVSFSHVPAGTTYQIAETGLMVDGEVVALPANGWTQTGSTGTSGTIAADTTSEAEVTNAYDASGSASLEACKRLVGGVLEEGRFGFELYKAAWDEQTGAWVPDGSALQTKSNGAPDPTPGYQERVPQGSGNAYVYVPNPHYNQGMVAFDRMDYTQPGTYHYLVREQAGTDDALIYDGRTVHATVVVADRGNGTLSATVTYEGGADDQNLFSNSYKPGELSISKTVEGGAPSAAQRDFTLRVALVYATGFPASGVYDYVVTSGEDAVGESRSATFDANGMATIVLRDGQTATFAGLPHGVRYTVDETNLPSGYALVDSSNTEGTIHATRPAAASFTNGYAASGSIVLEARKRLVGAELKRGDFAFELLDAEGEVIQVANNGLANGANTSEVGAVVFGPLSFTHEDLGAHTYFIREIPGGTIGVSYDSKLVPVTVTVTDEEGNGTLATRALYGVGTDATTTPATFTNTYTPPSTTTEIRASKRLDGRAWKEGETFQIKLTRDASQSHVAPMPPASGENHVVVSNDGNTATATVGSAAGSTANATAIFADIPYTLLDLANEDGSYDTQRDFYYTLEEVRPTTSATNGLTYDTSAHAVRVHLVDHLDGRLTATAHYEGDDATSESTVPPTFVNEYEPAPTGFSVEGWKLVNGTPIAEGAYSFDLYDNNDGYDGITYAAGMEVSKGTLIGNASVTGTGASPSLGAPPTPGYGRADVTPVTFTKPGTYRFYILEHLPSGVSAANPTKDGMTYDTHRVEVTVTVTDDGVGALHAAVTYSADPGATVGGPTYQGAVFRNIYEATGTAELAVAKHIAGRTWLASDTFAFTLAPVNGAPLRVQESEGAQAKLVSKASVSATATTSNRTPSFPTLHYELADLGGVTQKVFSYTVSETTQAGGMTKPANRTIAVKVSDADRDGVLDVSYATYDASGAPTSTYVQDLEVPQMTNTYTITDSKQVTLQAKKAILDDAGTETSTWKVKEGADTHDWSGSSFSFVLMSADNNTPMPEGSMPLDGDQAGKWVRAATPASLATEKLASFGTITYTQPGTYVYEIREVRANAEANEPGYVNGLHIHDHLVYDATAHAVTVVVEDNGDGTLKAPTVTYDSASAAPSTFRNREQGDTEIILGARKTLAGRTLEPGEFTFELYATTGLDDTDFTDDKLVSRGTSADGGVEGVAEFTYEQLGAEDSKVFYFAGREVVPADATNASGVRYDKRDEVAPAAEGPWTKNGITYDATPKRYEVTVSKVAGENHTIKVTEVKVDGAAVTLNANGQVASPDSWPVYANSFAATGSASVSVAKHIEGRSFWNDGESYGFELTPNGGAPLRVADGQTDGLVSQAKLTTSASKENHANTFPTFVFTQEDLKVNGAYVSSRDFVYTVREVVPADATNASGVRYDRRNESTPAAEGPWTKAGVAYDDAARTVGVRVENDGTSTLKVTYAGGNNTWINTAPEQEFVNTYSITQPVTAQVQAAKRLTGRPWQAGDTFTFRIVADEAGNPMPMQGASLADQATLTVPASAYGTTADQTVSFAPMTFTAPGTYTYSIQELAPASSPLGGVTYATTTRHTVKVVVTDNGDGTLGTPQVTYYDGASTPTPFVNAYRTTPTSATLMGRKTMVGRDLIGGHYSFQLYAAEVKDGAWQAVDPQPAGFPETMSVGGASAADGVATAQATSRAISFTQTGTYRYIVREVVPTAAANGVHDGVTYDTHDTHVTVTVTDKNASGLADGVLRATVAYDNNTTGAAAGDKTATDQAAFTNTYATNDTTATLSASKDLRGRAWNTNDSYTFSVAVASGNNDAGFKKAGAPLPSDAAASAPVTKDSAEHAVTFGALALDRSWLQKADGAYATTRTFSYEIRENAHSVPGVSTASGAGVRAATVTLTDHGDGRLTASVAYEGGAAVPVFVNTYTPQSTELALKVRKHVDGRPWKAVESYRFVLSRADEASGAPMPATSAGLVATATAEGADAMFGTITITADDMAGAASKDFVYLIAEQAGTNAGMRYNTNPVRVTVRVTDNGAGQLSAHATYGSGGSEYAQVTNDYHAANAEAVLAARKVVSGRGWDAGETFSFTLGPSAGAADTPLPAGEGRSVTASSSAAVSFGAITYTEELLDGVAWNAATGTRSKTFAYTIAEDVPADATNADGVAYSARNASEPAAVGPWTKDGLTYGDAVQARVTLTDDGSGVLATAVEYFVGGAWVAAGSDALAGGAPAITNTYATRIPALCPLGGTKSYTRAIEQDQFKVELYAANAEFAVEQGAAALQTVAVVPTQANATKGTYAFEQLSFDEPGTYYYVVREYVPAGAANGVYEGVVYDTHEAHVTIVVTDLDSSGRHTGVLTATASYDEGSLDFANAYRATPTIASLSVSKTLAGRSWDASDGFEFVVSEAAGAFGTPLPAEDGRTRTATRATAVLHFGSMEYGNDNLEDVEPAQDGTRQKYFYYLISENGAGSTTAGVASPAPQQARVLVTDDGKGTLTADVPEYSADGNTWTAIAGAQGGTEILNTYSSKEAFVSLHGIKRYNRAIAKDQFSFALYAADEGFAVAEGATPLQTVSAAEGTGAFAFDALTYDEPGTHRYVIREVVPSGAQDGAVGGITYDTQDVRVTVAVDDVVVGVHTGELTAEVTYDHAGDPTDDEQGSSQAVFANRYDAQGQVGLSVVKRLVGRDWEQDDSFDFVLEDEQGAELQRVTVQDGEPHAFEPLAYTVDDLGMAQQKTFVYTVREVAGTAAGMAYDSEVYTMRVVVADEGNGTLRVEAATTDGAGASADASEPLEFVNEYAPAEAQVALGGTKTHGRVIGQEQFAFALYQTGEDFVVDENGKPVQTVYAASGATSGSYAFALRYDKAGTYHYVVREVVPEGAQEGPVGGITYDTHEARVTVRVSDEDQNGQRLDALVATVDSEGSLDFNNPYAAEPAQATVRVRKVLSGRVWADGETFRFALTAEDDAPMPAEGGRTCEVSKDKPNAAFGSIAYTLDDLGGAAQKTFVYTIAEEGAGTTKDGMTYAAPQRVRVRVSDEGTGRLSVATPEYSSDGTTWTPLEEGGQFRNTYTATSEPSSPTTSTSAGGTAIAKTGDPTLPWLPLACAGTALLLGARRLRRRR